MSVKVMRYLCGLLLIGASLLPLGTVFTQGDDGLVVDAAQELGEISRYSYGTNFGPWAAVPFNLLSAADEAGITFIRFPGGNWGDLNNLRHTQIDDFIRMCQRMGAEPSISVRLEGGTPEAAVELVRYTNIEQGYGVRYWSIGNEPDLYDGVNLNQFDPSQADPWNSAWRTIAEAMLAVDPSIVLIGPETSQYPPPSQHSARDDAQRAWLVEFLKANGDLVDIVSVHRYPFPRGNQVATRDDLLQNLPEWDAIVEDLRRVVRETVGHDMPIAVTEFSSHWSPAYGSDTSPDSFFNALWLSDVLGRLISHKVDILAQWTLQSPNSYGGWGLLGQFDVIRPAYYVYQLYKRFGTTLLGASSSAANVRIYAARQPDGTLTVMVINLNEADQTLPLQLDHFTPDGDAQVWRFDAEHNAELLGTEPLAETVTLPGLSITLYVVPGQ